MLAHAKQNNLLSDYNADTLNESVRSTGSKIQVRTRARHHAKRGLLKGMKEFAKIRL